MMQVNRLNFDPFEAIARSMRTVRFDDTVAFIPATGVDSDSEQEEHEAPTPAAAGPSRLGVAAVLPQARPVSDTPPPVPARPWLESAPPRPLCRNLLGTAAQEGVARPARPLPVPAAAQAQGPAHRAPQAASVAVRLPLRPHAIPRPNPTVPAPSGPQQGPFRVLRPQPASAAVPQPQPATPAAAHPQQGTFRVLRPQPATPAAAWPQQGTFRVLRPQPAAAEAPRQRPAAAEAPTAPHIIPMVRPVPAGQRRPIETPSSRGQEVPSGSSILQDVLESQPARPRMPPLGQLADIGTQALEPTPEAGRALRLRGRLQAALDALLPENRRYKHDSLTLAAWLRDNGVVVIDSAGNDRVPRAQNVGSDRLVRLGILNAFPHFDRRHVAAIQEALAGRYERQSRNSAEEMPSEPNLTVVVREALPKAGKKRS